MTPRIPKELLQSLRDDKSRACTPIGDDLVGASLGTRLSGSECYRRLLCLRFGLEYTSLPLGTQKLVALSKHLCERESEQREDHASWTAGDLAKALQTASEKHIWLQLLRTGTKQRAESMNWEKLADEFILWLGQAAADCRSLQQASQRLRFEQAVVLTAWWAYLTRPKAGVIRSCAREEALSTGRGFLN